MWISALTQKVESVVVQVTQSLRDFSWRPILMDELHISVGNQTSTIPVRISYRIIELFSEGLYAQSKQGSRRTRIERV